MTENHSFNESSKASTLVDSEHFNDPLGIVREGRDFYPDRHSKHSESQREARARRGGRERGREMTGHREAGRRLTALRQPSEGSEREADNSHTLSLTQPHTLTQTLREKTHL